MPAVEYRASRPLNSRRVAGRMRTPERLRCTTLCTGNQSGACEENASLSLSLSRLRRCARRIGDGMKAGTRVCFARVKLARKDSQTSIVCQSRYPMTGNVTRDARRTDFSAMLACEERKTKSSVVTWPASWIYSDETINDETRRGSSREKQSQAGEEYRISRIGNPWDSIYHRHRFNFASRIPRVRYRHARGSSSRRIAIVRERYRGTNIS